jgi:hypothetical protein
MNGVPCHSEMTYGFITRNFRAGPTLMHEAELRIPPHPHRPHGRAGPAMTLNGRGVHDELVDPPML